MIPAASLECGHVFPFRGNIYVVLSVVIGHYAVVTCLGPADTITVFHCKPQEEFPVTDRLNIQQEKYVI